MTSSVYFGIDVSKAKLDLATESTGFVGTYANNADGIEQLASYLATSEVALVTIESTGSYSQLAADTLAMLGFPVLMAQPRRVRRYAESRGIAAKTDRIDSKMIAAFGASFKASERRLYQPPSKRMQTLRALVDRRDQIVGLLKQEKCHREACRDPAMSRDISSSIKHLKKRIEQIEQRIAKAIAEDAKLAASQRELTKIYGIASVTAAVLLTYLPELGAVNRQEIAALAGVACYDRQSGNVDRKRSIYGGRARVRTAMYMVAQTAIRQSGPMHEYYQKLLGRGKIRKVALIACARKMLVLANTVMKDHYQRMATA